MPIGAGQQQANNARVLQFWGHHDGFKHTASQRLLENRVQHRELTLERSMPELIRKLEESLALLESGTPYERINAENTASKLKDLQKFLKIRAFAIMTFNQTTSHQRYLYLGTAQQHEQQWTLLKEERFDAYDDDDINVPEAWALEVKLHKMLLKIFRTDAESWKKSHEEDQKLSKILKQSQGKPTGEG